MMLSILKLAERKNFAVKHQHIMFLRCFLKDSFEWAGIVPQCPTVNGKRKRNTGKDVGYHALLKKKNNFQSHRTYMAKINDDVKTAHRRNVKETSKKSEDNLFPGNFINYFLYYF
jgi:hypothetical protein